MVKQGKKDEKSVKVDSRRRPSSFSKRLFSRREQYRSFSLSTNLMEVVRADNAEMISGTPLVSEPVLLHPLWL